MLHAILAPLSEGGDVYNLFRYITFRSGAAMMTALLLSLLFGSSVIRLLHRRQGAGQPIRSDGPAWHVEAKSGTPTMGGLMILASVAVAMALWARWDNNYVWLAMLGLFGFGAIGFFDDLQKIRSGSGGLSARFRLIAGALVALAVAWIAYWSAPAALSGRLAFPFFKDLLIDLGPFYFLFAVLVIVGSANAVNLTDGLDGLAIVPATIAASTFGLISYLVGHAHFAQYLQLHNVPGTGELAVFAGSLLGAGLGFLWYNAPPAQVFMGDTGSLALGGGLGAMAIATMHELVLAIVGGLFVFEALSVMIQVASYRLTGRRVFRMAPIHHHFEQKGWKEPTIVIRFSVVAVILAMAGLATLKLR